MLLFAFLQISVHIYYMSILIYSSVESSSLKEDIYTNKNTIYGHRLV